jgi:hypothetical protein
VKKKMKNLDDGNRDGLGCSLQAAIVIGIHLFSFHWLD